MTAYPGVVVTGARGQLGTELMAAAAAAGLTTQGFGSRELDITDEAAVDAAVLAFAELHPLSTVVNAAAYTAVDAAESDSERAYLVNETGARNLATACARHGVGLIHVSTDYVFPGNGTRPYEPSDETGPTSVYGASKLAGERAVLEVHPAAHVVRTAWVWGTTGGNFVKTMAALEASKPGISVVDDQRGTPSFAADLAGGLVELAARGAVASGRPGAGRRAAPDQCGRDDLVRVRPRDLRRARRRSRAGAADDDRPVSPARAAPGVLRAVERGVAGGGADPAAGLARGADGGVRAIAGGVPAGLTRRPSAPPAPRRRLHPGGGRPPDPPLGRRTRSRLARMVIRRDVSLPDGRTLRAYDSGAGDELALLWHHGSPQTGALLEPLLAAAGRRGIRMLSYARPGYGGSTPLRGRDVASAAADVAAVADAFGVGRFAVMGASGGGPHALACAALLPDRVTGVACLASIAPFTDEFDWFAGMVAPGGLRSALDGPGGAREIRRRRGIRPGELQRPGLGGPGRGVGPAG